MGVCRVSPVALLPLAAVLCMTAETASAAGFAIREQSATAQATAFAGATAGAEDVSYQFFNPAALALRPGVEAVASLSLILPRAETENGAATTPIGTPVLGSAGSGDVAEDALVPAFYLGWHVTPAFAVGLGISAPFGLTTEYEDDFVGRYHGLKSELVTLNVTPAASWQALPWLALGGGLQIQYADAELSSALDLGTLGVVNNLPGAVAGDPAFDGKATITGDSVGFGFNLGLILTPREGTRVGLAYRSAIPHTLEGDADLDAGSSALAPIFENGLLDDGASATIDTPDVISAGIHQSLGDDFAVMAEVAWTRWSTFEELVIEFDSATTPDNVTEENWEDSFFLALGASWKPAPAFKLSAGLAYDQSPVPDEFRTPRIPDADRFWMSLGGAWSPSPGSEIALSYTHIEVEEASIDLADASLGSFTADYESAIDIIALSGRLSF